MKKLIYNKIDKQTINGFKRVGFFGKVWVIQSPTEAQNVVDYLLTQPLLGLDTETRPSFTKGQHFKCSLLQVSTKTECFLFRLNFLGLHKSVKRLLSDRQVLKVGLAWNNDLLSLRELGDFETGTFIDLQNVVKEIGIEDQSLVKIYANLFNERISKSERLSNWERTELTEGQKLYAAIDAWACVRIYEEVERLKHTGEYELINVISENRQNEENIP